MRALIVDDEAHVRKAIKLLVNWEEVGIHHVAEAENGSQALELIQTQVPDIIVTDIMMPLLNGFEMMERIQALTEHPPKFIVVSGYNDFEYIQRTLRGGGIDYLLKPVDRRLLQKALIKAAASCRTERKIGEIVLLEQELLELKQLYRDKSLSELLTKRGLPVVPEPLARALPELARIDRARVIVARFNAAENGFRSLADWELESQLSIWKSRLDELLRPRQAGVVFKNWNKAEELVLLCWDQWISSEWLKGALQTIDSALISSGLHLGVAAAAAFPSGLHDAYREASDGLARREIRRSDRPIHLSADSGIGSDTQLKFHHHEEELLTAIQSGNKEQLQRGIQTWLGQLDQVPALSLIQLQMWMEEYSIVKKRWLDSFGIHAFHPTVPLRIPLNHRFVVDWPAMAHALEHDLGQLQLAYIQSRQARQTNVMQEIARFLQDNYWKDIPMQDLSERFHMNKEHISRRFKQVYKETITEYTNRIRIEKAKILLLNPALRISEIAEMIGYHDEKYLSRVFKKFEKIPPNEYRKRNGGIE